MDIFQGIKNYCMKIAFFILLQCFSFASAEELQAQVYGNLSNKIIAQCIADMRSNFQLEPGLTGTSMPYDVEKLTIGFSCRRAVEIDLARKIAVLAVENLKQRVNNCLAILPYLREYPFPNSGAGVILHFSVDPKLDSFKGIKDVHHVRGNLFYYCYDDVKPGTPPFFEEPYEVALAIVKEKYPEDFPSEPVTPEPVFKESFVDTREIPFDITVAEKTIEFEQQVIPGIKATYSQNLALILQDLTQNLVEPYFDKAFFKRVDAFQQAHPDGEYTEYWGNGQIKFRAQFKEGMADGHFHGWYSSGHDALKGFFKNGLPVGIHIGFFPFFLREGMQYNPDRKINPKTAQSHDGRILSYNQKGQLHGTQFLSHPNGYQLATMKYVNGVLEGEVKIWKGQEVVSKTYKHGRLVKEERNQ